MLAAEGDLDCDIVYVDFDDLFQYDDLDMPSSQGYVDDRGLIAHYMSDQTSSSESDMVQSYQKSNPRSGSKPMTKEQFYKIRPKMPRINKSDPRRGYAAAYAEAYNSCDFDVIHGFLSDHCSGDFVFVQKWVGSEQYLNFPLQLEIKGVDAAAEYWFSRCLLAPDLALQLKVTKLFVRSDGFSSVASSFTIKSTRIFDGELTDDLIRTVANETESSISIEPSSSDSSLASSLKYSSSDERLDTICNRAIEKVERALLKSAPAHDPGFSLKRKRKRQDSVDSDSDHHQTADAHGRKRMPKDKTITLLGNVTMNLNEEKKIYRMEVSFALKPESS